MSAGLPHLADPPAVWVRYDREVRAEGGAVAPGGLGGALCAASRADRRAALRQAAALPRDELARVLPLVAVRCADWVKPVRARARRLLRDALRGPLPAGALAATAAAVLAVEKRREGEAAHALLAEAFSDARVREVLLDAPDPVTRRFAHRAALDGGLLPAERAAWTAAADPDRLVRGMCLAAVADVPDPDPAHLSVLLTSKWPETRAAAVAALTDAEPYLADRSGTVRAAAREAVRASGGHPADLCRAQCADAARRPYAPVGLAECAERTDEDLPLLRELTTHPVARVRASAVAGLRTLDPKGWQRVLPLLDDPSAAVVHEVTRSLSEHAYSLPGDELLARIAPERPYPQRAAALRLLSLGYSSHRMLGLMRMLEDPHPRLRARAALAATRRAYIAWPTPPEVAVEVLELLDRHHDVLRAWDRSHLREVLLRSLDPAKSAGAGVPLTDR
ncbi:hypothetical protein ABZO31_05390 [Streptomyces sp. HUAS MG47]|uniref:hypothetical protein n=1 Tax=Streptomyces solicamelliae TaxID=3231716 RepID=UPI003877E9F3